MDTKGESRKSILKQGDDKTIAKKRLSFASSAMDSPKGPRVSIYDIVPTNIKKRFQDEEDSQNKISKQTDTTEPAKHITSRSAELQASIEVTHACQSIKITTLGMCYMPQKKKNNLPMQQLPVMQMKDNMRNYYQTSLNSPFSKSLNIVIAGNKSVGDIIRTEMLCYQAQLSMRKKHESDINLKVENADKPTMDMLQKGNFFILLVCFEILSSLQTISNVLDNLSIIGAKPNINGLVLAVSPSREKYKNVLTLEEFHNFLDEHQLVHFWWSNSGRAQRKQVIKKLLDHIHTSRGFTSGTSCLMKTVVMRGIKEYQEQEETLA
ncbi:uncharacterized protein [Penaeus vannamei]|uniref:Uncharacterized protein n=1 Tax=Penaeus vannamei TaxID=6689 RepID=A0A423TI81_PENVA|nr:uncharacterized protein LOC113805981 [Penaeus vannamei]ROT76162.1 hypothetical protein C7M84_005230 [Penaeus vannamei]